MATRLPIQAELEFEIREDGANITWRAPIFGRRYTDFNPPYGRATLPVVIKALDAVQYPNHPLEGPQFSQDEQATLAKLGLWQGERVRANAYKTIGLAIFDALGEDGQNAIDDVLNEAINQRRSINYILRFPREAVHLAALPWELISNQDQPVLLSRGTGIDSCERYLDIDRALPPSLPSSQQLHMLALLPSYGLPEEIRQEEHTARLASWARLRDGHRVTFDELGPVTMRVLDDYLRNAPRRPDIIHFFGHGIYPDGEGYLMFDHEGDGKELVSASKLAAALGDVRLMVIHACQSAMIDEEGGLLTGVAPALSLVTGAVVAMQLTVRIDAATRFAEVFYDELLVRYRSLQQAVALGRQSLFSEFPVDSSWYVPTLYIRSREPRPFHLQQPPRGVKPPEFF